MKKLILCCVLVIFGAVYCQAQTTENTDPIDLIHTLTEAFTTEDYEAIESVLHENFMSYGPFMRDTLDSSEFIEQWKRNWETQFEELSFNRAGTISQVVEEGPYQGLWVFDWLDVKVVYKEFQDKPVSFRVHLAARIQDNKIAALVNYYNIADIQYQLGYKVVPSNQDDSE